MGADILNSLRVLLVDTLELPQRAEDLTPETQLFGAIPELDSFGVLQLVTAMEVKYGIIVDDDEFGADLFETVGTLAAFIERKSVSP